MDPLDVYCTSCLSDTGQKCMTVSGNQCSPHSARVRLAAAPAVCAECGAKYAQPCFKESGRDRIYPHETRGQVHANQ